MRPVGIWETLHQALDELVMRAARDQAKTAWGNLQMCAGLKASIDGATHTVGQRGMERLRSRIEETEEEEDAEAEEEEGGGGIAACLNNLNIETGETEEEAAEGLAVALEMEVEEVGASEGKKEGGGTQRSLGALEFLSQEADPSGTTLVDARNGFNEMSRLAMLWTV